MQRITLSVDDDLATTFDQWVADKGYQSRSEAFRDLLRGEVARNEVRDPRLAKYCMGTLSYVYNHHERQLASRLTSLQHDHHDLIIATMHAHLDHDNCVEVSILRGPTAKVSALAESLSAQTGVRHGHFHGVPLDTDGGPRHVHWHPRS